MTTNVEFSNLVKNCAERSTCVRKHVGAILIRGEAVISLGWNGIANSRNCVEAGCMWCIGDGLQGMGFERCICTHAEQAAVGDAARRGISTLGSLMYVSLRPCMNCVKLALSCGIDTVLFEEDWKYKDEDLEASYGRLTSLFHQFLCVGSVAT